MFQSPVSVVTVDVVFVGGGPVNSAALANIGKDNLVL